MKIFHFDVVNEFKAITLIILINSKSVFLKVSVITAIDQRGDRLNFIELAVLLINVILKKLVMNEFFGYNSQLTVKLRKLCTDPKLSYAACAYGYAFPIAGYDPDQLEPPFYRITNYYFPVGSSRKNLIH
ncbi:unnamed protein product [Pieris macdunnoughi]|uniref:Uncharacterized protein n=1 Tax=Pieris macdunnoughi TaxID=345717 RepID=A0A821VJS6_9NEOP|nr:unnamed protein product [Pieris macdunnoughi]